MYWLAPILIAQADAAPAAASVDPWALALGGGGSFGVVVLIVNRLDKFLDAWAQGRKRDNGNDKEHAAKETTRSQIKEQSESLAKVAGAVETTARIQERLLDELSVMRRESYQAHADIKAALKER